MVCPRLMATTISNLALGRLPLDTEQFYPDTSFKWSVASYPHLIDDHARMWMAIFSRPNSHRKVAEATRHGYFLRNMICWTFQKLFIPSSPITDVSFVSLDEVGNV